MRKCLITGRTDRLERHHLFGGAYRKKSDRLGLVVDLTHDMHNEPPYGAHHNKQTMLALHKYGQALAMERYGWDIDRFREEFGMNYLDEQDIGLKPERFLPQIWGWADLCRTGS